MHVTKTDVSSTQITLTIKAGEAVLTPIKNQILAELAKTVKIPGFRGGKVPPALVEKNVDSSRLQADFLDEAMTQLYAQATEQENVRPVTRPEVSVKKFVPFTDLEFDVTTHIVSEIKLPDYSKITAKQEPVAVTTKDVTDVIESLQKRMAQKTSVDRAAKANDEAIIDFKGVDDKGKAVNGAEGVAYPLVLGSNAFIPGFEDNVIGMKSGDEKTFTIKFPKDYGVAALANKDVTFTVTLTTLNELVEPKVDEAFVAQVGPFKTVAELKADIKKQLGIEREREALKNVQDSVVEQVVEKSKLELPQALIDQQITYNMDEVRRNVTYRGTTMEEYLDAEGMSEEEYKKTIVEPNSVKQLKTSLVLAEIAEKEKLNVTPEELAIRIQILKGQYQDPAMQGELDKPENQRDIASRMLSEKVIEILVPSK